MLSTNVAEFTENLWARPPTSPAGRVAKLGRADTGLLSSLEAELRIEFGREWLFITATQ